MGFWVWVWIMLLAMLAAGCSTEYDKGWSWGMMTEDGVETAKIIWDKKEFMITDPHQKCHDNHYHDPYTKIEYCLPEEFKNMNMIHLYRVK